MAPGGKGGGAPTRCHAIRHISVHCIRTSHYISCSLVHRKREKKRTLHREVRNANDDAAHRHRYGSIPSPHAPCLRFCHTCSSYMMMHQIPGQQNPIGPGSSRQRQPEQGMYVLLDIRFIMIAFCSLCISTSTINRRRVQGEETEPTTGCVHRLGICC